MKIPHAFFRLLNSIVVLLLRSPLHALVSGSILALRYQGQKSGREITVPARYLQNDGEILVVTSNDGAWWHNFRQTRTADVLLRGVWQRANVSAEADDPAAAGPVMRALWAAHPADAAYLDVRMHDGKPDEQDFEAALERVVLIRIKLA